MADYTLNEDELIDPSILPSLKAIDGQVQTLVASFRALQEASKGLELKIGGDSKISEVVNGIKGVSNAADGLQGKAKVVTELTVAVNEYNKMLTQTATAEGKLSVATSDEIKNFYALKAQLSEATKALRDEAAANTEAAKATKEKKLADDAAALALQRRINAEKEEARAQRDAIKNQRDNEVTTRLLQKRIDQLNAAKEKEAALLAKNSNAYEILKREYNEAAYATKTLAAQYVIAQKEGKLTTDQLTEMSNKLRDQQKATLGQANALLQMEQAVGQNQRAVGNYANATGEINQILRELPNFAISAQTGILSLSNNLPMLQAALSRLAQTTDVNTGKAIGWAGVLKTVGSSIFSVQGLLVLGTTLLVAFDDKLLKLIDTTSDAEKAQERYNAALTESNKAIADEVGELTRVQAVLTSVTASRVQQVSAINQLQEKYPNLFSDLRMESLLHDDINKRISEQIELLKRRAEDTAASNAITQATEELSVAQQKLNGDLSIWEKFWASRPWGAKPYNELTQGAKEAIEQQYKLYQLGVISKDQYNVMYRRLQDVSDAQGVLNKTVENSLNPHQQEIDKTKDEIKAKTELLNKIKEEKERIGDLTGVRASQIQYLEQTIKALQGVTQGYEDAADARDKFDTRKEAPVVTLNEMYLQDAKRRVDLAKEGSKEQLQARKDLAHAQYAVTLDNIKAEEALYKDDIQKMIYINGLRIKAQDDLNKALHDAGEKYDKKNGPSKFDPTNIDIEAQQRIFKAQQDLEKQQLETTNAYLATIYEDETQNLNKRLAAYDQYVLNKQAIEDNEFKTESNDRKVQLDKIAEIEKRYNVIFSETTADQIDKRKDITSAEKTLLHEKSALQAEDESATLAHNDRLEAINSDGQKKEREIIKNGVSYQVKEQTEAFRDLQDQVKGETALRLAELEQQRKDGAISEKNYWLTRQNILSSESQLLYQKEIDFLTKRKDLIIAMLDSPDISEADRKTLESLKNNLEKAFGDLQRSIPEPRKTESRSILSYLGFGDTQDQSDIFDAETVYRTSVDKFNATLVQNADNINAAREYAAQTFGEGTAEYAAYIKKAQEVETNALEQAGVQQDAAYANYVEKTAKNAEAAKAEIAKQIQSLTTSLLGALNAASENAAKAKTDALNEQSEAIKNNLDEQLIANEASSASEKEKARIEATLKATALADEKKLDAQRRTIARDEAIRNKRNALFQAYVNGGIAASKIIATYAANPVLEGILLALVAAQTLATVATISSQEIPAYWQGTPEGGHPADGPAKVSDRGVGPELMISPDGKMSLTPKKESTVFLKKGTHIIPANKIAAATEKMGIREMSTLTQLADAGMDYAVAAMIEQAVSKSADRITRAIENKPETQFNITNGELQKLVKKAGLREKWIGGLV